MIETAPGIKKYRANNGKALSFLLIPATLCTAGLWLSVGPGNMAWYIFGQLLLGVFFFQAFILLHETGHGSFFSKKGINRILGHFFGFLAFIPFTSWVEIHNLHHRWTGWRDRDPTTSDTVSPAFGPLAKRLVNLSWLLWLPIFTIAYRLNNYWKMSKLKKYLSPGVLKKVRLNVVLQLALYLLLFMLFGNWMLLNVLPAYLLSLIISDVFILSQHSHIVIPLAGEKDVRPIRYQEQVPYTRSVTFSAAAARLLFLNFNLHELHHAYPGLPAYYLHQLSLDTPNSVPFFKFLAQAKRMKGMDFIFSTSERKIGE